MMDIAYNEYEGEHGRVAMLYDPENDRAWIRSDRTVPVQH